ncbi:glycoside hydrolase family 17 protein [Ascoidea rubescens DSM 1968]|uniref:Glycoside hydrolase family 17 protein n=1 Tax=Ascoidea rubescens DSM 1968 TaxID=1344418 RepID=A0A1D2VAH6_9ASCO|nr:glycoside hydrolase family 17 protein [Ascoidea rubescens DSM 1968]ODV58555.1 glycoside hydrolase family 17 protein [Ascoidea rubescens DSM 1968]
MQISKLAVLSALVSSIAASPIAIHEHHVHRRNAQPVPSSASFSDLSAAAAGAKGITYSPYANDGNCKSAETIQSDVSKLSSFELIRLYATDCSGVENVLAALGSNQKILAGLYDYNNLDSAVSTLASAVKATSRGWDSIYAVSVGNEWVNSGSYSTSQVKSAVESGRSLLSAAGFTGPVVSVDTYVAFQNNPVLCEYSDIIAVNSHPFFDGNTEPSECGSWLLKNIQTIWETCGGQKSVLITEAGWPHSGSSLGVAVPSYENQLTCIKSIQESCGSSVFMFTMYDDLWKDPGSYGVEQSWGVFSDS